MTVVSKRILEFLKVGVASGAMLTAAIGPAADGCVLPRPAPIDAIGRAQLWLPDPGERANDGARIEILWSDEAIKPKMPGVYALRYMMSDRDPDRRHDVDWYKANHPTWLELKCDGSPAHLFHYAWGYFTSLDIKNPQVRAYLMKQNLGPVLDGGRFDGVSVDNLGADNIWGRCGAPTGNGFRRDYTGERLDPAYPAAYADWMQWLRGAVNAHGLCLAGNDYFLDDNVEGFLALANSLDIVFDEHGFTRNNRPLSLDQAWRIRINGYLAVAAAKPLVIIDYPAPTEEALSDTGLSWSLANFLLIKGPRTYLAVTPLDRSAKWTDIPALAMRTGVPLEPMRQSGGIFSRRFEQAIAVVNPSSGRTGRYGLPGGSWRSLDGRVHSGEIDLPPASAMVLTKV